MAVEAAVAPVIGMQQPLGFGGVHAGQQGHAAGPYADGQTRADRTPDGHGEGRAGNPLEVDGLGRAAPVEHGNGADPGRRVTQGLLGRRVSVHLHRGDKAEFEDLRPQHVALAALLPQEAFLDQAGQ